MRAIRFFGLGCFLVLSLAGCRGILNINDPGAVPCETDVQCDRGFVCGQDSICETSETPCSQTTTTGDCPLGRFCAGGACLCGDANLCECDPSGCDDPNNPNYCNCQPTEGCIDGACVTIGPGNECSPTNLEGACPTGEVWTGGGCVAIVVDNECSPAQPNGLCPPGTACQFGYCVPIVNDACSDSNPSGLCPAGQVCTSGGGGVSCQLAPCSTSNPTGYCGVDERCEAGACQQVPCSINHLGGECPLGEFCSVAGACVINGGCLDPDDCSPSQYCSVGELCLAGGACVVDEDCEVNQFNQLGIFGQGYGCGVTMANVCGERTTCIDDNDCLPAKSCGASGTCLDPGQCEDNTDCNAGTEYCSVTNECIPNGECRDTADCSAGEFCSGGTPQQCLTPGNCDVTGDCYPGHTCSGATCVASGTSCTTNAYRDYVECGANCSGYGDQTSCQGDSGCTWTGSACEGKWTCCATGETCCSDPQEVCSASTSVCIPRNECADNNDCPPDFTCELGTFVCVADTTCTQTSECGVGQVCSTGGYCIDQGRCSTDIDCVFGETCNQQYTCEATPECSFTPFAAGSLIPPNMMVTMDRSGSMQLCGAGDPLAGFCGGFCSTYGDSASCLGDPGCEWLGCQGTGTCPTNNTHAACIADVNGCSWAGTAQCQGTLTCPTNTTEVDCQADVNGCTWVEQGCRDSTTCDTGEGSLQDVRWDVARTAVKDVLTAQAGKINFGLTLYPAGGCGIGSCDDGVQNQDETGVDCGGATCGTGLGLTCADGQTCLANADCTSGYCDLNGASIGYCAQENPGCNDGVNDPNETDLDCGGPDCAPCPDSSACIDNRDCQSGVCSGSSCQTPTCGDATKNGDETDVDCGGSCGSNCTNGQECSAGTDCTSSTCQNGICVGTTCTNATQDGDETDVDCGGSCGPCADGDVCDDGADCQSSVCNSCTTDCNWPSCSFSATSIPGRINVPVGSGTRGTISAALDTSSPFAGTPTAATLNNILADPAGAGLALTDRTNAVLLVTDGAANSASFPVAVCEPACADGIKGGTESDIDCGGLCPRCIDNVACTLNSDCVSDVCKGGLCVPACETNFDCQSGLCRQGQCLPATCGNDTQDGDETDIDCGGSCAGCPVDSACSVAADCQDGKCTGGVCEAATCSDGIKNGDESDQDCGGSCATACTDGEWCGDNADCQSMVCQAGICRVATCDDANFDSGLGETDTDCGGPCGPCDDGLGCALPADCKSGACSAGNTCLSSGAKDCAVDSDCASGACRDCDGGSNPNGCSDLAAGPARDACEACTVNTVLDQLRIQDPPIRTFVVGFSFDGGVLNCHATHGGTQRDSCAAEDFTSCETTTNGPCYYEANDSASLQTAFDAILSQVGTCAFTINPASVEDPNEIFVYLDPTNGNPLQRINRFTDWNYFAALNQIVISGSACSTVLIGDAVPVVLFGCAGGGG